MAIIIGVLYVQFKQQMRMDKTSIVLKGATGEKGDKGEDAEVSTLDSVDVKITNPLIITDNRFSIPTRATEGSAAIDLRACITKPLLIPAGESVMVGTGIAVHIKDPNYVGMILPRSGLGSKNGIVLGNLVGLIDSDYQGELMVSVWNRSCEDYTLEPATKFAQYTVVPVVTPRFNLVEDFENKTSRGVGGFGSTGL